MKYDTKQQRKAYDESFLPNALKTMGRSTQEFRNKHPEISPLVDEATLRELFLAVKFAFRDGLLKARKTSDPAAISKEHEKQRGRLRRLKVLLDSLQVDDLQMIGNGLLIGMHNEGKFSGDLSSGGIAHTEDPIKDASNLRQKLSSALDWIDWNYESNEKRVRTDALIRKEFVEASALFAVALGIEKIGTHREDIFGQLLYDILKDMKEAFALSKLPQPFETTKFPISSLGNNEHKRHEWVMKTKLFLRQNLRE